MNFGNYLPLKVHVNKVSYCRAVFQMSIIIRFFYLFFFFCGGGGGGGEEQGGVLFLDQIGCVFRPTTHISKHFIQE